MATPSVKGYMPLCVTPRSKVCDEQGVGQWPMWKRFNSVQSIVDQYVDEKYRNFFAFPYYEIDKLKAEELFYWYTPRCDISFVRLNRTGDDHDYFKGVLDATVAHYQSVISNLKKSGKTEEANFLQLSLNFVGESEENIYCGDGFVVATVWGMRTRKVNNVEGSTIFTALEPEPPMHTVSYELGKYGSTNNPVVLNKRHGSRIYPNQVPSVKVKDGYEFTGWDNNPLGMEVTGDLLFTANYKELPKEEVAKNIIPPVEQKIVVEKLQDYTEDKTGETKQIQEKPYEKLKADEMTYSDNVIENKQPSIDDTTHIRHRSWSWGWGKGRGFWRWVLRVSLFVLLAFLVLYIIYLCNPCSK